jgi:hypothetical protein
MLVKLLLELHDGNPSAEKQEDSKAALQSGPGHLLLAIGKGVPLIAYRRADKSKYGGALSICNRDIRFCPIRKCNYGIKMAADNGHIDIVKFLLLETATGLLTWQHVDIVKLLLSDPKVDPSDEQNSALNNAASKAHLMAVDLLLGDKRANPAAN